MKNPPRLVSIALCGIALSVPGLVRAASEAAATEDNAPPAIQIAAEQPSPRRVSPAGLLDGVEISFRGGYHDWNRSGSLAKGGGAVESEIVIPLGRSPLDLVFRGNYAASEAEDLYDYANHTAIYLHDGEFTVFGGSAQLRLNFMPNETLNPYLAAGCYYEKERADYDYT